MRDYAKDFNLDPAHTWLNAASEGPLPNVAVSALEAIVRLKQSPYLLTIPKFVQVPIDLKAALASLLKVNAQDIILGNSATYGLHLLANGFPFIAGDEILLMAGDFPTDILPWLSLPRKGVVVKQVQPKEYVLTLKEIEQAITGRTKIICLPHVHSFSGFRLDIPSIAKTCKATGIMLVLNTSPVCAALPILMSK